MEEDVLSFDSIMDGDQAEFLFSDSEEESSESNFFDGDDDEESEEDENSEPEATVKPIVREEDFDVPEDTDDESDYDEQHYNENTFADLAYAFREEGIFDDISDDDIDNIEDAYDFKKFVDAKIQQKVGEKITRIENILEDGGMPNDIQNFENQLQAYEDLLNSRSLTGEDDHSASLRREIIRRDCKMRGMSDARINREIEKSIKAGTDIEDAIDSLESLKRNTEEAYNDYRQNLFRVREEKAYRLQEFSKDLYDSMSEENDTYSDFSLSKSVRDKAYRNLTERNCVDSRTGERISALTKYERENKREFLKNVSLLFTITDGFKNMDKFVKGKVNKSMKRGFAELEHKINGSRRFSGGSLEVNNVLDNDPESYYGKGYNLFD